MLKLAPPRVKDVPFFGNAAKMMRDPLQYLIQLYHEYGAVASVTTLGRELVVISGLEANRLLAEANHHLISKSGFFGGMSKELGTDTYLTAIDGEMHHQLRKIAKSGYSRQRAQALIPKMILIVERELETWEDSIPVIQSLERIIAGLIGFTVANTNPNGYVKDFRFMVESLMYVYTMRIWPTFMLKLPVYQKAKDRAYQFAEGIIAEHRQNPPIERHHDLVDDLLMAKDEAGNGLSERQILVQTMTPFFVGIDTATASCSFLMHLLSQHPDALEEVQSEVDGLFKHGMDFRQAPALHRAILETLRLYPISPLVARHVVSDFEFGGYAIKAGQDLIIGTGVCHYLPAYYENPTSFSLHREDNPPSGVFMPFGAGTHTCMGSGIAEIIMAVTMATLLHHMEIKARNKHERIEMNITPIPNPGKNFYLDVKRRC